MGYELGVILFLSYRKECEKFNMAPNVSTTWQLAEKLINEDLVLWTVMKEYSEGI